MPGAVVFWQKFLSMSWEPQLPASSGGHSSPREGESVFTAWERPELVVPRVTCRRSCSSWSLEKGMKRSCFGHLCPSEGKTPAAGAERRADMYVPESLHDLADSEVVQFVKKPKTISRIFAGVFSLIVFATLLTDGYQNLATSPQLHCVLNDNAVACSFAVVAGLLAFLGCLLFLTLDTLVARISSTRLKTTVLLLDFSISGRGSLGPAPSPLAWPRPRTACSPGVKMSLRGVGGPAPPGAPTITRLGRAARPALTPVPSALPVIWVGVWFVGFCFLANQWQRSPPHRYLLGNSSAKAAIAFSFFSIPVWMALAYLALQDLRSDPPVPYKRSLDEGGVALTTLSSGTTTMGPNSLGYPGSMPPPYPTTPKTARLAMMNDN
uniref:MARVEL domain-containing protein n=1 Tax=Sarcophilus harrisii TaxID=9305 RepID=A0A7N4NN90_SARHA